MLKTEFAEYKNTKLQRLPHCGSLLMDFSFIPRVLKSGFQRTESLQFSSDDIPHHKASCYVTSGHYVRQVIKEITRNSLKYDVYFTTMAPEKVR